jgi:hypothetical protein
MKRDKLRKEIQIGTGSIEDPERDESYDRRE